MARTPRANGTAKAIFTIPDFTDQQLSDAAFSRNQINDLGAKIQQRDVALADREKQLVALNSEFARQQVQLDASKAELTNREATINASNRQIADLLAANADLRQRLDQLNVSRPKIAVDELVRQLSGGIERLNADARKAGGTAFLVDNLHVQIKAGIDISNGVQLSQLPESAVGVDSVSTLSFALKPMVVIRMVEDDET